jgi:hypothetical protein
MYRELGALWKSVYLNRSEWWNGRRTDSVLALELLLALETEFGIVMNDDNVQPRNLANVDRILSFVKAALARPG